MDEIDTATRDRARQGRLEARPGAMPRTPVPAGIQPLGLSRGRDGLLYVPSSYRPQAPAPFLVVLHSAGATGGDIITPFIEPAESGGVVLLAPDSRGPTWDLILGAYGPDVRFLDAALRQVFSRLAVDRRRLPIGGFSDGVSYALSLGLIMAPCSPM